MLNDYKRNILNKRLLQLIDMKVQTKTLSLMYDPQEDRMKLIINKDDVDRIEFWITRRFYFSLLFELETFLEKLQISIPKPAQPKKQNKSAQKNRPREESFEEPAYLLKNINIRYIKERKAFTFVFQSDKIEAESFFALDQFLNFYTLLKGSFPKGEWGII